MKTNLTVENTLTRIEALLDALNNASTDEEKNEMRSNAETSAKLLKLAVTEHANIVRADAILNRNDNTKNIMGY